MRKESAYNVYTTTDYGIFKRLVGNRDIPESRISKIVESIQTIGWVHNPIIVNERMEVIDGQGRLTALQRLKMPVEYIVAEGAGNKECIYIILNNIEIRRVCKYCGRPVKYMGKQYLDKMGKTVNGYR